MKALVVLPVLIPLTTASTGLLLWRFRLAQRRLAVVSAASLFGAGLALLTAVWRHGILTVQMGNWPAPFGITLAADPLSAIMVALAGCIALAVTVYSLSAVRPETESLGYHPFLSFLLTGVCGAFLTGDLFNLYVFFEVILSASFVLLTQDGSRAQLEGGIKFAALNLVSSALFLASAGLLYGLAGTLNMADLARKFQGAPLAGAPVAAVALLLVAFGIKAAVFPLFFWLPASYHTAPVSVTTIFSALSTKVGVYAMLRLLSLAPVGEGGTGRGILLVVAGLTMVTGVLGAVAQTEFRRLLSFHIVSQIGYLLMGVALFSPRALAGAVFFMVHIVFAKSALFLVSGITARISGTNELKKLGGFYARRPGLSLLFLVPALSLAGVPPLSGFWAKLALVQAALESGDFALAATALGVSLFTMFSMTKIWAEVFWKEPPAGSSFTARAVPLSLTGPAAALAFLTVALGAAAGPLYDLSVRAAEQLLEPSRYIQAVLGSG